MLKCCFQMFVPNGGLIDLVATKASDWSQVGCRQLQLSIYSAFHLLPLPWKATMFFSVLVGHFFLRSMKESESVIEKLTSLQIQAAFAWLEFLPYNMFIYSKQIFFKKDGCSSSLCSWTLFMQNHPTGWEINEKICLSSSFIELLSRIWFFSSFLFGAFWMS